MGKISETNSVDKIRKSLSRCETFLVIAYVIFMVFFLVVAISFEERIPTPTGIFGIGCFAGTILSAFIICFGLYLMRFLFDDGPTSKIIFWSACAVCVFCLIMSLLAWVVPTLHYIGFVCEFIGTSVACCVYILHDDERKLQFALKKKNISVNRMSTI